MLPLLKRVLLPLAKLLLARRPALALLASALPCLALLRLTGLPMLALALSSVQLALFADGNILFELAPKAFDSATIRKPTAYDGMQSSHWVSRNAEGETYGVTGGGAREFLASGVAWSNVRPTRWSARVAR